MNTHEQSVVDYLEAHREAITETCAELVRKQSVNPNYPGIDAAEVLGGETDCNERLAELFEAIGCDIDLWEAAPRRHNLVGTLKGRGGGRSLALNGHVDTVPITQPERWLQGGPLSGAIENGRIWGRGTCDMKGGLTAQFWAAKAIVDCGVALQGDLILQSVLGEETMDHELGTTNVVRRGHRADAGIVTEPTAPPGSLNVVPVTPGMLWMALTVRGKASHASVRDELVRAGGRGAEVGVNAIEKGVILLQALQRLEEHWGQSKAHPLFRPGHFTIHPGVITGGPEGILVPFLFSEFCTIEYSIWYPPQEDVGRVQSEIEEYVLAAAQLDPWMKANPPSFDWKLHWPPAQTDEHHPVVETMLQADGDVRRQPAHLGSPESRIHGFCAVCDASYLNAEGIPSVIYGPGTVHVAHAVNEYVEIDELVQAAKGLAVATMRWCGVADN
jgi:acetylornithine deacetylase